MNDQRDLEGLSALITGATSGIGKAAAEELTAWQETRRRSVGLASRPPQQAPGLLSTNR
jgi:NAD(P)-dependent dehydrogenase (short-subunit alcohol dehydrogenase family)